MYSFKLTSFIIFSAMFWTVSVVSATLTWSLLNSALRPRVKSKEEPDDEVHGPLKEESEVEDNDFFGGPVKVKKEQSTEPGGSMWLQRSHEDDVGGIGSWLESEKALHVQKRKGHSIKDEY